MSFSHIEYSAGVLTLLDQRRLPADVQYVEAREAAEAAAAIRAMIVRGAPAIGIAGAYGMAMAARAYALQPDFLTRMIRAAEALTAARPTAVNLGWAVGAALDAARRAVDERLTPDETVAAVEGVARRIHDDDVAACRRIGDLGAALLPAGASVLTHCNTGSLATGGFGTALGIVRAAWRDGLLRHVFVGETRPRLQGSTLTAWELAQDGIPHTIITDSMAAHFMRRGDVQAVLVGADRIARNGDFANKIGTYGLALLAKAHALPFIVAAPSSTFDAAIASGDDIPIEERDVDEVTSVRGVRIAPPLARAANPAFDITPTDLVSAMVTERGVFRPPLPAAIDGLFAIAAAAAR